jgi:uncharacterized protein with FMN-binding domain
VKKALFSLAFVAASGVYVAAANHVLPLRDNDGAVDAQQTAAPVGVSPIAPAASAAPLLASSQPASSEPAPIIADVAPLATPLPASRAAIPRTPIAQTTPSPIPPLPRPRPTPSAAAVQEAASSTVAAADSSGYRDGTYTGSSENAYYGRVQVRVTVANHRVAGIKVLNYPSDRRTSRYINSQALPLLQQEVIAANSSDVDTVSGATLTSEAYIRSLGTALRQAGTAGA